MPKKLRKKVCIIGAGSSGIAACKELHERGIPFDCFEISNKIGGNWQFKNSNKMSSAYRSLHINTSRRMMEFKSFPMDSRLPDFPHHSDIAKYFEMFVDHFGFRHKIRFESRVEKVTPLPDHSWSVVVSEGRNKLTQIYDYVIVANGHHWDPRLPEKKAPGNFAGKTFHSHYYIDPEEPYNCRGKHITIVGMGNSAMDIACELGQKSLGNRVFLSARRPVWVLPKYLFGKAIDSAFRHPGARPGLHEHIFPGWFKQKIFSKMMEAVINLTVGHPEKFGLLKPGHPMGKTHPTISGELHTRLFSGDVIPKPAIKEFAGDRIVFSDHTSEKSDIVIYATGYNISFPFLDQETVSTADNDLPLFFRIFHPQQYGLLFLGLVQPLCAIMPIAELQSSFIADFIEGKYLLPEKQRMIRATENFHNKMKKKYVDSQRHTIQIDCTEYTFDLRKELKRGYKRSSNPGPALAVSDQSIRQEIRHSQT